VKAAAIGAKRMDKGMKSRYITLCLIIIAAVVVIVQTIGKQSDSSGKPLKFGATYMTMNNPYFVALDESIKEMVESNGDILISRDPLQDQEKQNQQIKDMVEDGIDLLFLNPVNWKEVQPAIEYCKEKEVPIIVVDTNVYEGDKESGIISTITSDNYNAGVLCAEDMMKKLKEADIVILNHNDVASANQRVQGFLDTIKDNPQYRVAANHNVATELEEAMEEMKDIISSGLEFDVVLGGNDLSALGSLAAMQMTHMEGNVLLYGIDGSPDAKDMIKAGYMEGTSAQSPIGIGDAAAKTAYDYLEGKPIESSVIIPVEIITKENLRNYDIAGWQ